MASTSCDICCEGFNRSNRRPVTCSFCEEAVCNACVERYLVSVPADPHCMKCRREWGHEFLIENLTKTYLNGRLRRHREDVLFDRERALLPSTQPLLAEKLRQERLKGQIRELKEVQEYLKNQLMIVRTQIGDVMLEMQNVNLRRGDDGKIVTFSYACPFEGCKGYINDATYACGTCERKMCRQCHEGVLSPDHVCDQQNVASVALLKRDTKPCPNCHTMIHKIIGCAQMFCTQCEHVFNWVTGMPVRGVIHNPEYLEHRARKNSNGIIPRDPQDFPCGGLPDWNRLSQRMRKVLKDLGSEEDRKMNDTVYNMYRVLNMLESTVINNYRVTDENMLTRNSDLRVLYLENKIDVDEFKRRLVLAEKNFYKMKNIHDSLHMFVICGHDIIRKVVAAKSGEDIQSCIKEMMELQTIYRESSLKIVGAYNCTVPFIDIGEGFVRHR